MKKPPIDPKVADLAPSDPAVTTYDEEHIVTCLRLLDADAEGADWRDVSRIYEEMDFRVASLCPTLLPYRPPDHGADRDPRLGGDFRHQPELDLGLQSLGSV
jgi:hypothetical protein